MPSASAAGGPLAYEALTAQSGSPAADFISFAVEGGASQLTDAAGRRLGTAGAGGATEIPGGVVMTLGAPPAEWPALGVVTSAAASPYTLELVASEATTPALSLTFPRGDGTFARAEITDVALQAGGRVKLTFDLSSPSTVVLEIDATGARTFVQEGRATQIIAPSGPRLISANVIGPETLDTASPFGLQAVALFDRRVDAASAAVVANYQVPANQVRAAKAQLSGRLVFLSLAQPEGPYVPTTFGVSGITGADGLAGQAGTLPLAVRLLDDGGVVSGRVLNADGTPVSTGSVTYLNQLDPSCTYPSHGALSAAPLSGDGRYELRYVRRDNCGLPFKLLALDPVTGALRQLSAYVRTAGEQIVLDMLMFGRGSVTGTVRQNGVAVFGAQVAAFSGTDPQIGGSAVTDADGRYTINGITVGPVTVRAAKGTVAGQSAGRIDRAGSSATVDVTLDAGTVRVSGTVTKLEGGESAPLPALNVYYYLTGYGPPMGAAVTDANGHYSMSGLPSGSYAVEASLNTRDRARLTGIAAPGDDFVQNLVIAIPPPSSYGTVAGTVKLPDASPAAGVLVTVNGGGVLSDANGLFAIPGVPVQPNQMVSARTKDGLRSGSTTFSIMEAGQTVQTSITLSGLGSVQFTVLDPAGQPVPNLLVRQLGACADPCGCAARATNTSGEVRFDGLPLGSVAVQAILSGSGAVDVASGTASVTRDGETGFAVLRFGGAGTVRGKVLDPDGNAAFGADVALNSRYFYNDGVTTCGMMSGVSHRVQTDPSGEFRFTGVNVGPVSVTVTHPFFPTQVGAQGTLTADGQEVRFDLKLVDTIAGVLSGTVYLPDGTTPAGAGIEVSATGPLPEVKVKTNTEGIYRFAKIFPQGTYTIIARDPVTGGTSREQVYLRTGQDSIHDQRLKGKGTVRVRVVTALNEPVTSAFVRLRETDFPNGTYEAAIEESNEGVASFESVIEGPFSLEVSDSLGRGGRASSVLPHPGDTVEVKVSMTVTGTVQGTFRMPNGATIPFGDVSLSSGGRPIGQTTTRGTDPVGTFRFEFVPAGDIRIDAQDPLTARTGVSFGRLDTEGQVLTLDVQAQGLGAVEGTVTSNGQGIEAHVDVVSGSYRAATTSEPDGHYTVTGVPEGHVVVTASLANGFLSGSANANLTGDGSTATIDVALKNSGGLTGQVLAADGSTGPVSVVTVQAGGWFSTTTDAEGHFAFERLPAGAATLTAQAVGSTDQGAASAEVPAGATVVVDVKLNGIGSIQGHTLDSAGQPIAGDLRVQGTGTFGYGFFLKVGNDGFFRLPEVLAGPFTASLTARSGEFLLYGTASGTLAPNETTSIDVQVQPSGTVTGLVARADGTTLAAGAQVTVKLEPFRGNVALQAQGDGRFTFHGVPLGPLSMRVNDPITKGVALVKDLGLSVNGEVLDVGTIVLDDSPVAVVSVDPPDGAVAVPVGTKVRLTFSDPLASVYGVWAQKASGGGIAFQTALSADGLTATLDAGQWGGWPDSQDILITASTDTTDIYGRRLAQAFAAHFRTLDLSPPAVQSIVPANGAIQVAPDATVTVTFKEDLDPDQDVSEVVAISGGVSGSAAITAPGVITFTPSATLAINTMYGVTVNGTVDRSGNKQTVPFSSTFATLDTVPPVLNLAGPPNGGWMKTAKPSILLYVGDALSGIDASSRTLVLDGQSAPMGDAWNIIAHTPTAPLADGPHTYTAAVNDRAGNVGTFEGGFGIDTQPPGPAAVTGVVDGQTVQGAVTLAGSADDTASGVAKVEVLADSAPVLTVVGPAFSGSYNTTALSEGPHVLAARATDVAGNVGPVGPPVNVVVDNKQITLVISNPDGSNPRFRDTVFVKALASEPVARVDFFAFQPAAVTSTVADGSDPYEATLDLGALAEGPATITAKAVGLLGDSQVATKDIVVDRTPPAAPDPTKITAEESDAGFAQVAGVAGAVEGQAVVEVTNTATGAKATATAAQDGSFAVRLEALLDTPLELVAVDSAGNRSAGTIVIVVRTKTKDGVPVAGLALWVSADSGVTKDASGAVSAWADQSGKGNHLTQTAAVSQPHWIQDGFNGWPVLRFDGTSDSVRFTTRLTGIRTAFWVVREDAAATAEYRPLLGDGTALDFLGDTGAPGPIWYAGGDANPAVLNGQTFLNGTPVDGRVAKRPTTMSVISLVTAGNTTASSFAQDRTYSSRQWWGDLAELIIYDRPLTSGERQSVEEYLVAKYRPYTPTAGTPSITPAGSVFAGSTTVQLSTGTPGATIRYTLDGSEPNASSPEYVDGLLLTETTTVKAKAFRAGFNDSATATASFIASADAPPALGMKLWLRADAGIATNAGSWISQWNDQSGNGDNAIQTNGIQLPKLIRSGSNGLPVMRFDGNDVVRFTTPLTTIRTVFWVVKEDAAATADYRPLLGDDYSPDFLGSNGAPGAIWDGVASAAVWGGQTFLNGLPIDGRYTARPRSMSVISLVTTANTVASTFAQDRTYPGRVWWGDLAELIIYDRPLSAEERKSVEDYLMARYQIGSTALAPTISPPGGLFTGSVSVALATRTPGAEIFYTTDGAEPTTSSIPYAGPLQITATTTLNAMAFRSDLGSSVTATAGFTKDTEFHPATLSGLQLWLRADAGTPTGLGDFWRDQSAMGNHASQSFSGAVARIAPNVVNGLPVMRFDGSDFVRFTSRMTTIRSVFWVVKESAAATAEYRPLLGDGTALDFLGGTGAPGAIWYAGGDANPAVLNGQTFLNGVPIDGRATSRPRTTSVISLVTTGNTTASTFAQDRTYSMRQWWGDLAELIIYDRPLITDERKQVEDYLRIKYWDVSATSGDHQVSLSWMTRPGAVAYDLERSTTSGSGHSVIMTGLTGTSYTNVGLDAETTYFYRVVAVDSAGNRFPSREVIGTPLRVGTGTGLAGDYFNAVNLSGTVVMSRIDPTVNFNFGSGSPDALISSDNFSVRWTGQVQATVTGDFVFTTNSDDGVRLWIDGKLVIDNWTDHGDTANSSAPIRFLAGERHDVRLEWYERSGGALIRLQWAYPGQALQPIPQSQLYPVAQ